MNAERWHRVTAIFHVAVERPKPRVEDFLRAECAGDMELYSEVSRMLQEHSRSGVLDRAPVPPAARSVFTEGQLVSGRYRIQRFLNRGGMGEVYEAVDQELKEQVALKTLLPEIAADRRMIERFKQEIQLSRKISHPNVCRVFDLARHPSDGSSPDTTFFLTMELLPGETLSAMLEREGRMTCDVALPLLRQMAEALDAAHRAGIVHRDFKPSNVMVVPSTDGVRAVVTDFGLARSFSPTGETTATRTEGVAGTLDYMAPELLTGQSASEASDVYALGMVAYKMVAGALPFSSDTPLAGAILRSKSPVPSPRTLVPDLDPKWERAILRALAGDRMHRFSRPEEFLAALRGEGSSVTLSLPAMTRRRWIAAAAVLLGLVGGWLGWRSWQNVRSQPPPEAAALYRKGVDDIHAGAYFAATKALTEAGNLAPHFTLAHSRLAEAWVGLDVADKATQEMLLALGEDNSGLSRLDRLQIEAMRRTVTRKYRDTVETYREMLQADPKNSDRELDLGRAYESASQPEEAIACYRRITESQVRNPAAWLRLAILYDRRSNVAGADEAFGRAAQLYELTSNLEGRTEVAYRRGVAARGRGNSAEALKFLGEALEMARVAANPHQEIRIKLDFSNQHYEAGDIPLAEKYARDALDIARANQLEYFAVSGIIQLGNAYRGKQDFEGAEKLFQEGLDIARRNNAQRMVAVSLMTLASLHLYLGRSQAAAHEAGDALAFYQANGFSAPSRQGLLLLGRAQRNQGDLAGARKSFQTLLESAEATGDRGSVATAHEALGSVESAHENYPEALNEYRKYLDYCADARTRVSAHIELGDTLWKLGRNDEAREMFAAAEAEAAPFPANLLDIARARAEMAMSAGYYGEALAGSRRVVAATVQNPGLHVESQRILGLAQIALGQKREGLRNCEEGLRAQEKGENVTELLRARMALAQARLESGDTPGFLLLFEQIDPVLATRPESRWRALALKARVDPQAAPAARRAFDELHRQWGDDAFRRYQARADVVRLSRPFLRTNFAN